MHLWTHIPPASSRAPAIVWSCLPSPLFPAGPSVPLPVLPKLLLLHLVPQPANHTWAGPSSAWSLRDTLKQMRAHQLCRAAAPTLPDGENHPSRSSCAIWAGKAHYQHTNCSAAQATCQKPGFSRRRIQSLNNAIGFWQLENSANRKANEGDARCLHRKNKQQRAAANRSRCKDAAGLGRSLGESAEVWTGGTPQEFPAELPWLNPCSQKTMNYHKEEQIPLRLLTSSVRAVHVSHVLLLLWFCFS